MGYSEHPWYLGMMLIVLAMDAIQAIPFAYLRYKKRPIKFAGLKLLFILVSILLNILYFVVMKGDDVGVAFLINLICLLFSMTFYNLCIFLKLVIIIYCLIFCVN